MKDEIKVSGTKVYYFYTCHRQLWFFDKNINMEQNSERVKLGKLLSSNSYSRRTKREIQIDCTITIDILENNKVIEVKLNNKLDYAQKMQLLYYLYYLKKLGIEKKGILAYPKLRKREEVELKPEDEKEIENALLRINEITSLDKPPILKKKPFCTKCSYYELCFSGEL